MLTLIRRTWFTSTGSSNDARAAGESDIGFATSTDAFSQFWNPSKYVFSDKNSKLELLKFLLIGEN